MGGVEVGRRSLEVCPDISWSINPLQGHTRSYLESKSVSLFRCLAVLKECHHIKILNLQQLINADCFIQEGRGQVRKGRRIIEGGVGVV